MKLSLSQARSAWLHAQGLLTPSREALPTLLARTGWLRTIGGAEGYLSLLARRPGTTVAEVNAALASESLVVRPCVRGCVYALPAAHEGLGVRVAAVLTRTRTLRDLEKLEVLAPERDALADKILTALSAGPLTTDGLRNALKGQVRSLGEAGKKLGLSSPLPSVVRLLEFDGRLRRTSASGLDSERYAWSLPAKPVFAGCPEESDTVGLAAALARIFFAHAGPATLDEFASWSGFGKRDAKAAMATLQLDAVEVEGVGEAWALAGTLGSPAEPDADQVLLLGSLDNYTANRSSAGLLVDPENHSRPASGFGSRNQTLGSASLPDGRFLVRGGRIVGLWDFDPDAQIVRWGCWSASDRHPRMAELAEQATEVLRAVGHGRVFALDSADGQRKRVAALP